MIKLALAFTVFCAVITKTTSEGNSYDGKYTQPFQGYTWIKRGKYNSGHPQRFYSRPPNFPKGAFSYTPPPNYMMNDEPPFPGTSRKVSKRPSYEDNDGPPVYSGNSRPSKRPTNGNEGLGEEDLQNFVKYLSKQDLDKIVEFAGYNKDSDRFKDPAGNNRESEKFKDTYEKHIEYRPTIDEYKNIYNSIQDQDKFSPKPIDDDSKIFNALVKEIDLDPKLNSYHDKKNDYSLANYATEPTPKALYPNITHLNNTPLDIEETMQSQITYNIPNNYDSKVMPEENLPRPMNLRDEDFEVSFTNNIPRVVKADSSSYQLGNFGDLPLMNYNSKLDTLSSYHVPHYTITSSKSLSSAPSSYSAPSSSLSSRVPSVEPAPPPSAAKQQSDAHLKAVRIWSHKSTGTAYTLHDDGTLSLEKPGRPRSGYGYP